MKGKPWEVTDADIRRVMGYVGGIKSDRKAKASRENAAKAREAKAKKKQDI